MKCNYYGKTCEDCIHCICTVWKSWQCVKNHKIEDLVPCTDFKEKLMEMKIDRVKGGYMLYKTIESKTHQLFITEEEASEISARYEFDFDA